MRALGIETSCDETSCAVVQNRKVLANVTVSSLRYHRKYGGVVPEIASRNHLRHIDRVFSAALEKSGCKLKDIDVLGVSSRPGLIGALLVGLNFVKSISAALEKPFLGVNHLHAHIFAPFLDLKRQIPFPFVGLVASGGHTDLFLVKDFDKIRKIGSTRDDACGEALDKVARSFDLGYPGGVEIDRLYSPDRKNDFSFRGGRVDTDFSFSGIKTAVIYKKMELEKKGRLSKRTKLGLISSFQESLVLSIASGVVDAALRYKVKAVVCGGGVTANSRLRQVLRQIAAEHKLDILLPKKKYSTDNAAMVAGLAVYLYNKGVKHDLSLTAYSTAYD